MKTLIIFLILFSYGCKDSSSIKRTETYEQCIERNYIKNISPPTGQNIPVFVFIGQSNMSGRAAVVTKKALENVWQVKNNLYTGKAQEPTDSSLCEPYEFMIDENAGQSLVIPFASEVSKTIGKIIVVQCSKGGSKVDFFTRDDYISVCFEKINIALKYGYVDSLIIWQGESDSNTTTGNYDTWDQYYYKIIDRFESNIGYGFKKFIFQLMPYMHDNAETGVNWNIVMDKQLEASEFYSDSYLIKTDTLPNGIGSHTTSQGYILAGKLLSSKYLSIIKIN